MKIYDISKGYFTAPVYPGDPVPRLERLQQMQLGDKFNLTAYYGGAHAATHMDAPRHFVDDGATIDQVPLEACFGPCTVLSVSGILTGEDADEILQFTQPRLLLRGEGSAYLSQSGAFALADGGIALVGTDASSIAPYEDAVLPHQELLLAGVPILEGLDLSGVGWKLHSGRVSTETGGAGGGSRTGGSAGRVKRCFNVSLFDGQG